MREPSVHVPAPDPAPDDEVETRTEGDGSLIIRPRGVLDADRAVPFRQMLVHAVRRTRPNRLVVELDDVTALDSINLGTLAALCDLADDHRVPVVLAEPTAAVRAALLATGIPTQRIRCTRDTSDVETPEVAPLS